MLDAGPFLPQRGVQLPRDVVGQGYRSLAAPQTRQPQKKSANSESGLHKKRDAAASDTYGDDLLRGPPGRAVPQQQHVTNNRTPISIGLREPAANEVMLHLLTGDGAFRPFQCPLSQVTVSHKPTATIQVGGHTYVALESPRKCWATAARFHDYHPNIANITTVRAGQEHWGEVRGVNRPYVLYEHFPRGQWAYNDTTRPKKPRVVFTPLCHTDGRVFLNPEGKVMQDSVHLPLLVSTEIKESRIIAIQRHDPNVRFQDFIDRMPLDRSHSPNGKLKRPNKGALQTRCARARQEMRILAWPAKLPQALGYSDRQIQVDMNRAGILGNSTRDLVDLTKDEIKCQNHIMYAGQLARGGDRKLSVAEIISNLDDGLTFVKQHGHAEGSEGVRIIRAKIQKLRIPGI